jgi:hypothetical protein
MNKLLVSVSGGRSSAMMARHIQQSEKYKDFEKLYVFANTGMERPETIQFLKDMEDHWGLDLVKIEGVYSEDMGVGIKYKIVDYDTIDMNAKVFEESVKHYNKGSFDGLPYSKAPYCSQAMKQRPIDKLAKDVFGTTKYITAIGFRKEDMPKRINWIDIKHDEKRIYPLLTDYDEPVGVTDLGKFWNQQPFKLNISSHLGNCELCWKKSDKVLVEAIQNGTRFVGWWKQMEDQYGNTAFRNKNSIMDYVAMSKSPETMKINFEETDDYCLCTL